MTNTLLTIIFAILMLWIGSAIWVVIQIADKDYRCVGNRGLVLVLLALFFPFVIVPIYLIYIKRHEEK